MLWKLPFFIHAPHHKRATSLLLSQSVEENLASALGLAGVSGLLADLLLGVGGGVGVEAEQDLLVAERVLLLDNTALGAGLTLGGADNGLDFRRVDEAGQVGVGNGASGQEEVLLEGRGGGGGAVDLVQGVEGGGGPDDEAAEVTTGGELEEVEGVDGGGLNTGDVAEGTDKLLAVGLGVVDDQRTAALAEAAVTQLTLTGAHLAGLLDLDELVTGTKGLQEGNSGLGLGQGSTLEGLGVNNEGDLGDLGDAVATGEEEGGDGRSSQSRSGSETLLVQVDLLVPLAPDLGGSEHATRAALVTEGSLTGTVSTTTRDTGNTSDSTAYTGHSSAIVFGVRSFVPRRVFLQLRQNPSHLELSRTGTPGLSRGLLASLLAHSVGLSLVLGHAGVHLPVKLPSAFPPRIQVFFFSDLRDGVLDNVRTDGGSEDGRQGLGGPGGLTLSRGDRDGRAGGHCCRRCRW